MTKQEQAIETLRKISDIETGRNYAELHEIKSFNYDLLTAINALSNMDKMRKQVESLKQSDQGKEYTAMEIVSWAEQFLK